MTMTWTLPAGTDGTAATQANTGTSQAPTASTLKSAKAYPGRSVGVETSPATSSTAFARKIFDDGANANYKVVLAVWTPDTTPNVDETIATVRTSTPGVIVRIVYKTTGELVWQNNAASVVKSLKVGAGLSTGYVIRMSLHVDTTTSANGTAVVDCYAFTNLTTTTASYASFAVDLGTATLAGADVGNLSGTVTTAHKGGWALLGAEGGTTGSLPPLYTVPANVAPVATIMARPNPQAPGVVTVTGGSTDSDGTVDAIAVVVVSGPNNPTVTNGTGGLGSGTATVSSTFTGIAGRYVVKVTSADNNGAASNEPTQIIDVYAATGAPVLPYAELVTSGYAGYGGAASDLAAVTDGSNTTGIIGTLAPAAEENRWQWCAFGPGDVEFDLTHDQTPTTPGLSCEVTVFKEDAVTQIYQTTIAVPTVLGTVSVIKPDATALALIPNPVDRRALITRTRVTQ